MRRKNVNGICAALACAFALAVGGCAMDTSAEPGAAGRPDEKGATTESSSQALAAEGKADAERTVAPDFGGGVGGGCLTGPQRASCINYCFKRFRDPTQQDDCVDGCTGCW